MVLGSDALGLSVIDASTGKAWASTHGGVDRLLRLQDDLLRWQPSELVLTPKDAANDQLSRLFPLLDATMVSQHNLSPAKRDERLRTMLNVADLGHLDLDHAPLAISATGLAADYLATVTVSRMCHCKTLRWWKNRVIFCSIRPPCATSS